jgi:hypothetical protein
MTEIELTRDALIVHVRGMDQLWALKSRLEIPISHVVGAELNPEVARQWRKGIRAPTCLGSSRREPSTRKASGCSGTCMTRRRRW